MCVTTPINYGDPGFCWDLFENYLRANGLFLWLRDLELLKAENARLAAEKKHLEIELADLVTKTSFGVDPDDPWPHE